MGILTWIIFGALVGWIASLIMRTDAQQGAVANIVIGIIGAIIGGLIAQVVTGRGITGFNISSFIIALIGAIVLIFFIRLFSRGHSQPIER